ncbi:hypothetical protein OQA88_11364 [Cercophora sp. LCS_1]
MRKHRRTSSSMLSPVAVWASLLFVGTSRAAPGIAFPINSQVPPVARVGQPFSFVFSPSTFTSTSPIAYTLANPPKWLSVDSGARRLYGTPSETDIGPEPVVGVVVSLVATDATGSATLDATLVVSRSPGPKLNVPLERQVPKFGTFSGSTISSAPQNQFSFQLASDTFVDPSGSPLNYYAVMADNTPLPAWISFDSSRLTFSGQTPPSESLIQPPQQFGFQLVASDVVGFAAASMRFDLLVGKDIPPDNKLPDGKVPEEDKKHALTADTATISLNVPLETAIVYKGLRDSIKVDGVPASSQDVSIASTVDMPSWLSIDRESWEISGSPSDAAKSATFTIVIEDKFSNTVKMTVDVRVDDSIDEQASLFKDDIPTITATAGESFSFNLGNYLKDPKDSEISVNTDGLGSWILFDSKNMTISGDVPDDIKDSKLSIPVQAISKAAGKSISIRLEMEIRPPEEVGSKDARESSSRKPAPTNTDAETSPANSSIASTTDDYGNAAPNMILLAVILPIVIAIISLTCLLFFCYRRKNEDQQKIMTSDISGPLPGTFVMNAASGPFNTYPSTQPFHAHYDPADDPFTSHEEKSYVESRATFMSNVTPHRPQAGIRLLPPIEGSPSTIEAYSPAPLLSAASPISPLRLRSQDLRSGRSLSSISETSIYDTNPDPATIPMGGPPFRDAVEVHIPTMPSSITQTPESACTPPRSASPSISISSGVRPLRGAESRLGHYPSSRKFAWPWLKKTATMGKNFAAAAKSHATRKLSVATVDTFAHKREKTPMPSVLSPPPLSYSTASRPVTRRGPTSGPSASGTFPTSREAGLPSSPTMGYAASGGWDRDLLGVSAPGGDDDGWADMTVRSRSTMGAEHGANWTTVGLARTQQSIEQESPKVGRDLYLSGSSELGEELLSPSKWPRAEGQGQGRVGMGVRTSAGNGYGIRRVEESSPGVGKSVASEGSPRFL